MKNRATLVFMEQLVMLLVFALAAAACLGIFAGAHHISRSARHQDAAVILVRSGAETLKAHHGDWDAAARDLGAKAENGQLTARYDAQLQPAEDGCYWLFLREEPAPFDNLGQAKVWAVHEDDMETVLFCVTVAWQEVSQ